jgi:membrane-associated phospholipid phosphatase
MKVLMCVFLLLPAFAQSEQSSAKPDQQAAAVLQENQQAASTSPQAPAIQEPDRPPAHPSGESANRSVIKPKPGAEIIKPKDYSDATGYLHPFSRIGRYVVYDQKAVWTSPFHTSKKDAKWWFIFGGATGALIATDKFVARNAPNPHWLQTLGSDVSYLGEPYTLLPISAAFYFAGTAAGSDHFRETGLLSFETLANATIVMEALKAITARQRPDDPAAPNTGRFEASSSRVNSSFPSGHAIETFALASVVAHEYPHKLWVKLLCYGYAGGVVGARLAANRHFPGDVMAGGAIGWFLGDYIYGKRHNPALDKHPTLTQKILEHVRIGGAYPTVPEH